MMWIHVISLVIVGINCWERYKPFHPCRGELIGQFINTTGDPMFFCYKNFGHLNLEGTPAVFREAEMMCQDWHDSAHMVWILSDEEDKWVYQYVKAENRHMWLGAAKTHWLGTKCNARDYFWVPESDGIDTTYIKTTKMANSEQSFICGECSSICNCRSPQYASLNYWCPSYCSSVGYNDENCIAMLDYAAPGSQFAQKWKDRSRGYNFNPPWDPTHPSELYPPWGDKFCDALEVNPEYPVPVDIGCKMRIPICGVYNSTNEKVCSGHGYCLHNDDCFCMGDYFGNLCEDIHKCDGIRADNETTCSGRGNCTSEGNCVCERSFYGDYCEHRLQAICNGPGEMLNAGQKKCYKNYGTGYTYDEAQQLCKNWFNPLGIEKTLGSDVSKRSSMVNIKNAIDEEFVRTVVKKNSTIGADNNGDIKLKLGLKKHPENFAIYPCPPSEGYYWEDYSNTNYPVSKGNSIICIDPKADVFNQKWCIGMGLGRFWFDYKCSDTSYEAACQYSIPECRGIPGYDFSLACSGRGKCIYEDTCVCSEPEKYFGTFCEYHSCYKVRLDDDKVCNGNGKCLGPDWCECDDGYFGLSCNETTCYDVPSSNEDVCKGHGKCVKRDKCNCDEGYGLSDCRAARPCKQIGAQLNEDFMFGRGSGECENCQMNTEVETQGIFHPEDGRLDICYLRGKKSEDLSFWGARDRCKGIFEFFDILSIQSQKEFDFTEKNRIDHFGRAQLHGGALKTTPYDPGSCKDPSEGMVWSDGSDFSTSSWMWTEKLTLFGCDNYGNLCIRMNGAGGSWMDHFCTTTVRWMCYYRMPKCGGIRADQSNVCNGKGMCWEDPPHSGLGKCTCFRDKGFVGDYCDTRMCNGIISYAEEVCNGHGDCVDNGVSTVNGSCQCTEGWYGMDCEVTSCDGKLTNTTYFESGLISPACKGHGNCISPETCSCESKYYGDQCDEAFCFWKKGDDPLVCSGHGSCYPADTCVCNTTDNNYWGPECQYWECYGVGSDRYDVCSSGGLCTDINVCECFDGFYYGKKCDITTCEGIFSNDTDNVCSGKGTCWPFDTCACEDNLYGDCSKPICYGYPYELNETCNGHGSCIGPNRCECQADYYGYNCDVLFCYGIPSNMTSDVCSGQGTCIMKDNCTCTEGAFGKDCNTTKCNGISLGDDDNICSGRGSCVGPDTCVCDDGYYAPSPSFCNDTTCWGVWSKNSKVCNSAGECVESNVCNCTEDNNYYGIHCEEYFPQKKFRFQYDFLFNVRVLQIPYEIPINLLRFDANTELDVKEVFESIIYQDRPATKYAFGEDAKVTFIPKGTAKEINSIEINIGSNTRLLNTSQTYEFTFYLQDGVNREYKVEKHVFGYTPAEDEKKHGDFDYPYEDNNDKEDEDEDDDGKKKEKKPVVPIDDGSSDDSSTNIAVIVAPTTAGVLVILVCLCCCIHILVCFCCICCLCSICGYICVEKKPLSGLVGGGKAEGDVELDYLKKRLEL